MQRDFALFFWHLKHIRAKLGFWGRLEKLPRPFSILDIYKCPFSKTPTDFFFRLLINIPRKIM